MEKHCKEVINHLRRADPRIRVTLIRSGHHLVFEATLPDRRSQFVVAKSPRIPEHAVRLACHQVCRDLGIPRIIF